jgi:hypothetical protein
LHIFSQAGNIKTHENVFQAECLKFGNNNINLAAKECKLWLSGTFISVRSQEETKTIGQQKTSVSQSLLDSSSPQSQQFY